MTKQKRCVTNPGETNQWQRHIAQSPREFKTNSDQSAPDSSNLCKEDGDEVCNDDDKEEEESDNAGDGNHLHAIDVAAREEGDGGNGNAPTQEDKNLAMERCCNSYNQ